jgi:hypothetical protein
MAGDSDPFEGLQIDELNMPPHEFLVRDAGGRLVAVMVRTFDKRIWWKTPGGTLGLGGIAMKELPLYRSERLRTVPLEVPVVVTEGPKDCDAVWRARMPAVGTVTGASGVPSAAPLDVLRGRIVVLWPDNDVAGHMHMERVADALIGVAREIRWLNLPGLPPKGGAFDVPVEEIPRLVYTYARVTRAGVGSSREDRR